MNRPMQPQEVRARIHELASKGNDAPIITGGYRGAITGRLISICGNDFERYRLLYYLFPNKWSAVMNVSSKILKNWDWYGLYKWTDVHKDEDLNLWVFHPDLSREIKAILALDIEKEVPRFEAEMVASTNDRADQLMMEMGYEPDSAENESKKERGGAEKKENSPESAYDPVKKEMPVMKCGHEADMFSLHGIPYCGVCEGA